MTVLLEHHDAQKYESPYLGPFEVTDVLLMEPLQ